MERDLPEVDPKSISRSAIDRKEPIDLARRRVLGALVATGALTALPAFLEKTGLIREVLAATPDLTRDTLNGVTVFFVPGPDPYSLHQGESTPEPGGLQAGAGEGLFQALNFANPFLPNLADTVAAILNSTALAVNPAAAAGPFVSPFSNLSFAHKGVVFSLLEGNPATAPLIGVLPLIVGFLSYAETAVFNPATRTISGRPIGWDLSNYSGVSDGRDEFRGYFKNRRHADA
jgi:hypothetical protein